MPKVKMVKLEWEQRNCTIKERLKHAAQRITEYSGAEKVTNSTFVLRPEQIGVFTDFAAYLKEIVTQLDDTFECDHVNPMSRIIQPPRTGKTIIAGQLIAATGLITTIIVPTKTLVSQTVKTLREQLPNIPIGCYYSEKKQAVWWGVNVTTYQSVQRAWKTSHALPPQMMLSAFIIADEGHHTMTVKRQEVLRNAFNNTAIKLALTATPDFNQQRQLEKFFPDLIHRIGIKEAIDLDLLAPLRVWVVEVDVDGSQVKLLAGDFDQLDIQRVMKAAPFFHAVEIFRKSEAHKNKSALICCNSQQQAQDLYTYLRRNQNTTKKTPPRLRKNNKVEAQENLRQNTVAIILSDTSSIDRRRILQRFEQGKIDTLINVGVLIEGWNSPRCKLVLDIAPSCSNVRATQKFFRPMTKDGEEEAHIVVMIPRNLPTMPVLPMELFGWPEAVYEQGEMIACFARKKRSQSQKVHHQMPRIDTVKVETHIVLSRAFTPPTLDPSNQQQIIDVLATNNLFSTAQIERYNSEYYPDTVPRLQQFRGLLFDHPLFFGRGAQLLRYLKKSITRSDYVLFLAKLFPEAASDLFFYYAASKLTHQGSYQDDIQKLLSPKKRRKAACAGLQLLSEPKQPYGDAEMYVHLRLFMPEIIKVSITMLTSQEQYVLTKYFGLNDNYEHTLKEIANRLNVSSARVRQIKNKALWRLRHSPFTKHLEPWYKDSLSLMQA